MVVTARRADRLQLLAEQIVAAGGIARAVAGDITDPEFRQQAPRRGRAALRRTRRAGKQRGAGRYRPVQNRRPTAFTFGHGGEFLRSRRTDSHRAAASATRESAHRGQYRLRPRSSSRPPVRASIVPVNSPSTASAMPCARNWPLTASMSCWSVPARPKASFSTGPSITKRHRPGSALGPCRLAPSHAKQFGPYAEENTKSFCHPAAN